MSPSPPDAHFAQALLGLLPRLRRYARLLCPDTHSADDLVQDTIERAWARHQQWQPGSDLRAWLFAILHNRRIDLLRGAPMLHSLDDEQSATRDELAATPAPADDRLGVIDLQRALERLSPEHREVLLLVAVEQFSYDETALALGLPIGTVMSRLSRARQRLRAELADAAPRAGHLTRVK
jgi:RNA polymerase sigma-70 factor (ECF subfamily)